MIDVDYVVLVVVVEGGGGVVKQVLLVVVIVEFQVDVVVFVVFEVVGWVFGDECDYVVQCVGVIQ